MRAHMGGRDHVNYAYANQFDQAFRQMSWIY